MTEVGTITFQSESGSPLRLKDVMFVSGPNKNLISVEIFEDHGYDVIFKKGKEFLRHIATRMHVKHIRVCVKNMHKLEVEYCAALSTKAEKVKSRDVSELWHIILCHLHHGTLNIMQQITIGLHKGTLEQYDV